MPRDVLGKSDEKSNPDDDHDDDHDDDDDSDANNDINKEDVVNDPGPSSQSHPKQHKLSAKNENRSCRSVVDEGSDCETKENKSFSLQNMSHSFGGDKRDEANDSDDNHEANGSDDNHETNDSDDNLDGSMESDNGSYGFAGSRARTKRTMRRKSKRSKRVMYQSLWYLMAFYLSFIFAVTARIWGSVKGSAAPFPVVLLFSIFFPMQGFFNFLVYMRPRFFKDNSNPSRRARRRSSQKSRSRTGIGSNSVSTDYNPSRFFHVQ